MRKCSLGHAVECTPEQLGYGFPDVRAQSAREGESHADVSQQPVQPQVPQADDEPMDPEPLVAGQNEILIDGTRIASTSPVSTLKAACGALGIPGHGSRSQIFSRLVRHLQQQELLASHVVQHKLAAENARQPKAPGIPPSPSPEEEREHCLTHIPFQSWCQHCVANKAKQDHHRDEGHSTSTASLVSFDFGFASRRPDDSGTLTVLFMHDRHTKMMHAVPTPSKGGKDLPYLTSELCRFVTWLGYTTVGLRCDAEPSTLSLLEATKKALRGLGVHTTVEAATPGNSQGNGAAEITVQVLRNQANLLMQQLEDGCKAGSEIFSAHHPMYSWAMIHSGWLHNRFAVSQGETPYERCTGRQYTGKLCMFGEQVMGYLKPSAKGLPSWQRGIWLGKTLMGDSHIVSTNKGLFVTRSVRRLPTPWSLEESGEVEIAPWECAFATLGSKLSVPKRVMPPIAEAVPALPPGIGVGLQSGIPFTPDEAAEDPVTPMPRNLPATPFSDVPISGQAGSSSEPRNLPPPPTAAVAGPASPVVLTPAPSAPVMLPGAPTTPMELFDEPQLSGDESPSKRQRIAALIDGEFFDHEDDHHYLEFSGEELDALEAYDEALNDGESCDDVVGNMDELMDQLSFPYTPQEPKPTAEELDQLDRLAEAVEVARLRDMGVLLPLGDADVSQMKYLTTRFVHTWRDKVRKNKRVWLRRARYVAREFAWLTPERQDVFSPASSNITNRLLPALFLHWKKEHPNERYVLASIDINDAFLTVTQREATVVTHGNEQYLLGRVLPGQRDGSQQWFDSMIAFLKSELDFEECRAYPCLLRSTTCRCVSFIHVDDLLAAASDDYFENVLKAKLTLKYKLSCQVIRSVGDSLEFLKRNHELVEDGVLHIHKKQLHFDRLFETVGMSTSLSPKKVPCHPLMSENDDTPDLPPSQVSRFRTAIGILLYLANDMPECAYTIRGLAKKMSRPTTRSWAMLRHLAQYLLHGRKYCLRLEIQADGLWHSPATEDGTFYLELFSDSDWAADKDNRHSVSASVICFRGVLLSATSRSQRCVSLSSAEAEVYAAVSCCCDGVFLKHCLHFALQVPVQMKLCIDNSAALRILLRAGVGRVRHMSCRILWIQQYTKQKLLEVVKIPTKENVSDLCTKRLAKDRMGFLLCKLGVFDTASDELVGSHTMAQIRHHEDFVHSLQLLRQTLGQRSDHSTNMLAKNALQCMILASMATGTNALGRDGYESPIEKDECLDTLMFMTLVIYVFFSGMYFMMRFAFWFHGYFHWKKMDAVDTDDVPPNRFASMKRKAAKKKHDETFTDKPGCFPDIYITVRGNRYHDGACGHISGHTTKRFTPCLDCLVNRCIDR